MVQFKLKKQWSLKALYHLMDEEIFKRTPNLEFLAKERYPEKTWPLKYELFICSRCKNKIEFPVGIIPCGQKGVGDHRRCKQKKSNGKICGGTRSINWKKQKDIIKKTIFTNSKIKNTCESNLKGRELKDLIDSKLINFNKPNIFVNYNQILEDMFKIMGVKTLGSWKNKIRLLVKLHYSNLLKNRLLCVRVFWYPILINNRKDIKSRKDYGDLPTNYGDYLRFLITVLAKYDQERYPGLFVKLLNKNFKLSDEEKQELCMLQKYCESDEYHRNKKFLRIGWDTWGTTDNGPRTPKVLGDDGEILKRTPQKINTKNHRS